MRRGLLLLLLLPFVGFAADDEPRIVCEWVDVVVAGTIERHLICTLSGSVIVDTEVVDPDPGGSAGACTNCTGISVEECQRRKDVVINTLDDLDRELDILLLETLATLMSDIDFYIEELQRIKSVLNDLYQSCPLIKGGGDTRDWYFNSFKTADLGIFDGVFYELSAVTGTAPIQNLLRSLLVLRDTTIPSLIEKFETLRYNLHSRTDDSVNVDSVYWYANDVKGKVGLLSSTVSAFDCPACASSSGGGSSGGGGSTGGCPCKEYIQAVEAAVKAQTVILDNCRASLASISNDVNYIYRSYQNANEFKRKSGQSFQPRDLFTNLWEIAGTSRTFDWYEYQGLEWPTRIEFLLGSLAGLWEEDEVPEDPTDKASEHEQTIRDIISDPISGLKDDAIPQAQNVLDAFRTLVSSFTIQANSSNSVHLDVGGIFADDGLEFFIDSRITNYLRTCTTLIWVVVFLLVDISTFCWFFRTCIKIAVFFKNIVQWVMK